jgi:hypothetical protein
MKTYLIFATYAAAHSRADAEGLAKGLAYHVCGPHQVTRYISYPRETKTGQWALNVEDYELTPEEQAETVGEPEWPVMEEGEI